MICFTIQSDAIRNALGIQGIPFYLILDQSGNIIEKGSLIRPAFPETIEKIKNLLAKQE